MRKLLIIFYSLQVFASVTSPEKSDFKANNWEILVSDETTSTVDEKAFYQIPKDILSMYKSNERAIAIGTHNWETPYFSAWADKKDDVFTVNFWGGLARISGLNQRGFALIACHEFGHILGGAPYIKIADLSHMSSEGQSDYFATSCLKKYLLNFTIEEEVELNPYVASLCHDAFFKNPLELKLCMQVADAGRTTAIALAFVANSAVPLFETPSQDVVHETIHNSYPELQCRMDTYLAGALTPFFATQDAKEHRPACWFKKD